MHHTSPHTLDTKRSPGQAVLFPRLLYGRSFLRVQASLLCSRARAILLCSRSLVKQLQHGCTLLLVYLWFVFCSETYVSWEYSFLVNIGFLRTKISTVKSWVKYLYCSSTLSMVQISMDSTTLVSCKHCFPANIAFRRTLLSGEQRKFFHGKQVFRKRCRGRRAVAPFAAGDHPAWTSSHGHQHRV